MTKVNVMALAISLVAGSILPATSTSVVSACKQDVYAIDLALVHNILGVEENGYEVGIGSDYEEVGPICLSDSVIFCEWYDDKTSTVYAGFDVSYRDVKAAEDTIVKIVNSYCTDSSWLVNTDCFSSDDSGDRIDVKYGESSAKISIVVKKKGLGENEVNTKYYLSSN